MDSSPEEEVYFDSFLPIADEESSPEESSRDVASNEKKDKNVYFVLDKRTSDDITEEEENMSRDDKFQTAKEGDFTSYKRETILNSKVNVADRLKLFETGAKKDDGNSSSDNSSDKSQLKNQNHADDKESKSEIDHLAGSVYDRLWEGQTNSKDKEDDIYATTEPLPLPVSPSPSPTSKNSSIYSLATRLPNFIKPSSKAKKETESQSQSTFYLSNPPSTASPASESLKTSTNKGCQQGAGAAVPVDFITPVTDTKDSGSGGGDSEYTKLYFMSTAPSGEKPITPSVRRRIRAQGYDTVTLNSVTSSASRKSSRTNLSNSDASEEESFDWGSEFDDVSYQESIDDLFQDEKPEGGDDGSLLPDKPLPQKPGKGKYQIKRRCVIDLIISSEKAYLESLERILKQYERAILEAVPHPKARVRVVFSVIREIISHHKMFQIELAESVSVWDQEEKIGDVFTASFSKTMVVNAYSIYVNNFSAAMEEIKTAQRNKQSFDEILRNREKSNADRLSIFGLMVKPVQRFPQFIMCLQDLIKYSSPGHHDRRALQLGLTELENVTHMLNERKRCSEQKFQALQTIHQLIRQKPKHMLTGWNLDLNTSRRLIRYDSMEQVFGEFENMKCKDRRLILMNDLVLCVKIIEKEQSGFRVERLGLRWMAKLKDLELKDTAITPDMQSVIKREPGKIHIISSQIDRQSKSEEDPFHLYADLSEMLHDYTVLSQMTGLVSTLKRSYAGHGLSEELVHEVSRDLQRMIQIKDEQLRLVNSCSLVLVDNSRSDKPHYVLQTQTANLKQDWTVDFLMAKLAQDKNNSPAWDRTLASDDLEFDAMPAHFMKHLPVDVPRNYTKMKCAVSVFLTPEKSPSGLGVQHLWVCSSTTTRGQVSILSIHNSKPALTESFRVSNCEIISVELIPGCGETTDPAKHLFVEDTVWMTTQNKEILVFPLSNSCGVRRDPLCSVKTEAVIVSIKFVDERVFCGYDNGSMAVYSRQFEGGWNMSSPSILTFGSSGCPVRIQFVWEEDLWVSCGSFLFVVEIDSLDIKIEQLLHGDHEALIDCVTRAGMGIWVSFANSAFIKLFHVETLENLQEISVGHFLQRIAAEKLWSLSPASGAIEVTCLAASKGLLWIGTTHGVVLTLPLPRLNDGVPLYRGKPGVSLHSHQGPVKFLIPLFCSTNTTELKRSSTLRSTIRSRPSRRNLERERMELEESEKKLIHDEEESSASKTASLETTENERGANADATPSLGSRGSSNKSLDREAIGETEEEAAGVEKDENSNEKLMKVKENQNGGKDSTSSSQDQPESEKREDEDKVEQAFDDDPVILRGRSRRGPNLSFRSELAQRIVVQSRRMSGSCSDLTSFCEHPEVEVLYENLLEDDANSMERVATKPKPAAADGTNAISSSSRMRHTLSNFRSSSIRKLSSAGRKKALKQQQQVDNASHPAPSSKAENPKEGKRLLQSKSESKQTTPPSPTTPILSPSKSLDGSEVEKPPPPELPPKMPQSPSDASYLRRSRTTTTRGTVRKSGGNNAVIVLSGGDGYRDLDQARNPSSNDDASIMLWIYKF